MASVTQIIIFLACISFSMIIFVPFSGSGKAFSKIQNATEEMQGLNGNAEVSVPIIGTVSFPNVFAIFKGIFDIMLSTVGSVGDIFSSLVEMPTYVRALLIIIFLTALVIAAWGFWKGTNPG